MSVWKDDDGMSWEINLDGPKLKKIRDQFGVNLTALDATPWVQLDGDLILRVDVIWSLCADQARDAMDQILDPSWTSDDPNAKRPMVSVRGISEERFARKLAGRGLANATEALMQAVSDFFPPEMRSQLQSLLNRTAMLTEAAMARLTDPTLEAKLKERVEQEVDRMINDHLTRSEHATS